MSAYRYISTADTINVKSAPGFLRRIVLTETVASTITVYDEASGGTTNVLAAFKASAPEGTYTFDVAFVRGIQVVTAGASKLTVVFD